MINRVRELFAKYSQWILLILIAMLVLALANDRIEHFNVAKDIDFEELNLALDHVLECEGKPVEKCLNQVRDYGTFKEILGYEDFDIGIFIKLMAKRREIGKTLTKGQIISLLKMEDQDVVKRSFKKVEKFAMIEGMEDRVSVLNKCAEDLKKGREYAERENGRYQLEYKAWKDAFDLKLAEWNKRRQAAVQEYNRARVSLRPNEIEWGGKPYNCNQSCGGVSSTWCLNQSHQCKKCMCQCKYKGRTQACPPCNGDRIFHWLGHGQAGNCSKTEWGSNGPIVRDDINLSTYYAKHRADEPNKPKLANYPKPSKPVFQPLSVICQDCSQSQEDIKVEESKGINIKQINQCIAEIEGKQVEAERAANDAAKKALLENKAAEEEAKKKAEAEAKKRAEEEAAAAKRAESSSGIFGGGGVDTPSGEAAKENEGGINMLAIIGGGGVFFLFCSALIVGAIIWMYYNQ
jgi:hypothetical protein